VSSLLEVDFAQPEGFRPLSLDLRAPESAGAPLIVFLHGGGWLRGSRKVFTPGISDAQSFDRIVAAGFAIASCEYRLSGEARFPAQLNDVEAALTWLQAHADEYGVDASRPVLWGVSAGATLAALTGLRRDDVSGVVDWFGPADLFSMAEHDMGDPPEQTREARWIGGPAVRHPEIARRASPTHQVHAGAPPFHIAHGTADAHVPFAQSQALVEALRAVGTDVEFHPVAGGKHFWQGLDDTDPLVDSAVAFATRVSSEHTDDRGA
jgi:acetyl esterase/lipase